MTPLLRRPRLRSLALVWGGALVGLLSPCPASAQGVLGNRFDPSEKGSDWFENESLDYRGNLRPAFGVIADYAKDPVALQQPDGSTTGSVITDQLYLHVGASLVLWQRLRLGAELPIELAETGDTTVLPTGTYAAPSGAALGDLRLGADFRVWGEYDTPFRIAVGAQLYVPTGSPAHFTSTGDTRFMPRILVAGDIDAFTYAVRVGYEVNPGPYTYASHQLGDEVSMGAAIGLRFLDHALTVGPEFSAYTLVKNAWQATTTPAELLLGAHYRIEDVMVGLGVGSSFDPSDALGAPDLRVLAGFEWHPAIPEPPPPPDHDQDGIPDTFDACPDVPGPYDDAPTRNGCPPDRDHDGVPDEIDACPDVAGVKTDDPKTNGCPPPPPDRDRDGVLDRDDACPDVAGVKTSDPKTNGCPPAVVDPDRDKDGIKNEDDACPDIAGPPNEDPKKNGCPLARVENGQIKITEQVKFAENSAQILKDSDGILAAVVDILNAHPDITRLRVEGYTDNKGAAAYNQNLSKQRAAAVKAWLVKHKIEPKRLDSEGFGQEHPIDDNSTEAGRKNNRRVEFHIATDAAPPAPPAGKH